MPLTHNQLSKFTHGELKQATLTYADLSSGTLEILKILKDKEDVSPETYEKFKTLYQDFKKDNPDIAKDLEVPTFYDKKICAKFFIVVISTFSNVTTIIDFILKHFVK